MANGNFDNVDMSSLELVGGSVADQPDATKVPRAGNVSQEAIDQPQSQPMAAPQQPAPSQPDFSNIDLNSLSLDELQPMPDFADGSSPETPINKSPVSEFDRSNLSLGNTAGGIKYLKQRFEDAKVDRHGNIVVKDKGLWHAVDPAGWGDGDAWDRTREVMKDIGDLPGTALNVAGGVVGGLAGLPSGPGSLATAAAGGAAGETLRTSLGRLVGTYDATPEEQLKDIGLEALLGLGGEAVALTVKPGYQIIKNALKNQGGKLSNFGKEFLSTVYSGLGIGPKESVRLALDMPEQVISKADKAVQLAMREAPGGSWDNAIAVAQRQQLRGLRQGAEQAKKALSSQYARDTGELLSKVGDDFKGDISNQVQNVMGQLQELGYGEMVSKSPGKSAAEGYMSGYTAPAKDVKFKLFSDEEIAKKAGISEDQLPQFLGKDVKRGVEDVVKILNQYSDVGTLTGKQGAAKALSLRKAITNSMEGFFDKNVPNTVQAFAAKVKSQLFEQIGQPFADAGLGADFVKINKNFADKADIVNTMSKVAESKNLQEAETFIKKLVARPGVSQGLKDEVAHLQELGVGNIVQNLREWEAAKSFVGVMPKNMLGGNTGQGAAKIAATAIGQTNPRMVAKQIKYGNQALDFIKSLRPETLDQLLTNDAALRTLFQVPAQAVFSEDTTTQQLIDQGINAAQGNNGQGQ